MSTSARWRLNNRGFVELRNSPGVVADLQRRADNIARAAGDGFETRPPERRYAPTGRARVAVVTGTPRAMYRQAANSTLTHAIDAGR